MSTSSIQMPEPSAQPDPVAEPAKPERAPLVELLPTGGALVAVTLASVALVILGFARFGLHGEALVGLVFCPALVLLAAIDLRHRLLPNEIILAASLAIGLIVAASAPGDFLSHLAAGAAFGGFFFIFGTLFAGSIGMGDAKLGFLIGLALAAQTFDAALIASISLLVAALYVLAKRGPSARKETLPFGPFLALGGILAFFLG